MRELSFGIRTYLFEDSDFLIDFNYSLVLSSYRLVQNESSNKR